MHVFHVNHLVGLMYTTESHKQQIPVSYSRCIVSININACIHPSVNVIQIIHVSVVNRMGILAISRWCEPYYILCDSFD